MPEPCRTECGRQVTYEKIALSDGIFFSIPIGIDGAVHHCLNIQNADQDLSASNGLMPEVPEPYYHPDMIAELSPAEKANLVPNVLNYKDREKYRDYLYEFDVDVLFHLEDKLGFKEDREELRRTIGFYLNKIFTLTYTIPAKKHNIHLITRIIGNEFTYLELLGVLYLLDGFYDDAKMCFERMRLHYDSIPEEEGPPPAGAEWGMGNQAIIDLMDQRIIQNNVDQDGVKNVGGIWFDENWSEELKNYWNTVKKNQRQVDGTKSNNQSKPLLNVDLVKEGISDADLVNEIREFEKDVLRPIVRKRFSSEKEMNEELKSIPKYNPVKQAIGTLYDKALLHWQNEQKKSLGLVSEDPMNVGLLRFLDISELVQLRNWTYPYSGYLKDIVVTRNKLAHPNDYPEYVQKHVNMIIHSEIQLCKDYFARYDLQ